MQTRLLPRAALVPSWLLAALGLVAVLLGGAGGATLLLEHRLAGVVAGGLSARALHYNPFTGALLLEDVRSVSPAGGFAVAAAAVRAHVDLPALLTGPVALSDVTVVAPRVRIRDTAVHELAARLAPLRGDGSMSVRGLVLSGGSVRFEPASGGDPLVLHDVHVRLDRLLTGGDDTAPAFVAALSVDGSEVSVTGHPTSDERDASGYVLRIRARDLDVAALQRHLLDGPAGLRLERGRGDVEAELIAVAGRRVVSGRARLTRVTARVAGPVSRLRADEAVVAVDRFDVVAGAGRLSRLELRAPSLTVRLAPGGLREVRRLGALLPDVVVRRLRVRDGAITLVGRGRPLALRRLDIALQAREQAANPGLRLVVAGMADGRAIGVERTLKGAHAGLATGLIEIVHAVEAALAE